MLTVREHRDDALVDADHARRHAGAAVLVGDQRVKKVLCRGGVSIPAASALWARKASSLQISRIMTFLLCGVLLLVMRAPDDHGVEDGL